MPKERRKGVAGDARTEGDVPSEGAEDVWTSRADSRPPHRFTRTMEINGGFLTVSHSYPSRESPPRVRDPHRRSAGQPSAASTPEHAGMTPLLMTHSIIGPCAPRNDRGVAHERGHAR